MIGITSLSGRWRWMGNLRFGRLRRQDGQAAFEFLLVMPTLVVFFLLVIDFGLLMFTYVSIANAVREGSRYASVNCGTGSCSAGVGTCAAGTVAERVVNTSGGLLACADVTAVEWVNRGGSASATEKGDSVVVRVNHPYNFLFVPATIPVVSCADMRLERNDTGTGLPTSASGC